MYKNDDEELRKRKTHREHAFGGSVQSVLFCDITSELMRPTPMVSKCIRMAALKHRRFLPPQRCAASGGEYEWYRGSSVS